MHTSRSLRCRTHHALNSALTLFLASTAVMLSNHCVGQDSPGKATVKSSIGSDGQGAIIVEAHGHLPEPPVFFITDAKADVRVDSKTVKQSIAVKIKVLQGKAKTLSIGLSGDGQVTGVTGESLSSWAIRQVGDQRFLDLQVAEDTTELNCTVTITSAELVLPQNVELTHLTPGDSVGFTSLVTITYATEVVGTVTGAEGFAPLDLEDDTDSFQTASGGTLALSLGRHGAAPGAVELLDTTLEGDLHANGQSIRFRLQGTANVTEPNSEITILSGNAAVSQVPVDAGYRLRLATIEDRTVYKLVFAEVGTIAVDVEFVAALGVPSANARSAEFTIGASAVVPIRLNGFNPDIEFQRDNQSVVPIKEDAAWLGFLPATGRARLQWKTARKAGEGKLFFTTTGKVEAKVGAGLLRQDHAIDYQVLQGELDAIGILLRGPGEILDVRGTNITGWKVTGTGNDRRLDVTLSQPVADASQITIRSQTPLGPFPVRVEGLRLSPIGTVRHSGFLRLTNLGSVRLEPTGLSGLTQLAPDQFPAKPLEARQVYVYRHPAADHAFTIAVDRIQPEVNIAELVLYQLAETDRVIQADIELDVREAAIREWDFRVPSDYSIVSVTGANVSDYIPASETTDGRRNLKVIFGKDVTGRQLVTLNLEKNEPAAAGDWVLPRIDYPEAKTVRGNIGIIGAPGYRVAVSEANLLVEKPLSYFPKPTANLQQAFRVRERGWSATMQIELLDRSVQSDLFHLYSLSQETVYGSALINYFVTGAPVSEWRVTVPEQLANVIVDGQDIRTWRRDGDTLIVSLHQPVLGPYTLLVTFEEKPDSQDSTFQPGQITPVGVQGERGYIQIVSPMQVEISTTTISDDMLKLDPLELPAEFRLLSTAPALGTWQYTERPFDLRLKVNWFRPGTTVAQVVEFSEASSQVSQDGELVTDVLYYVKSRGQRTLRIKLPDEPVRLWEVSVNGQPVTARQADDATLIPLPGGTDPNVPVEVNLRLGKPSVNAATPILTLPVVFAPVLKTQWNVLGDDKRVLVPNGGTVTPTVPVLRPAGFKWVARRGIAPLCVIGLFTGIGIWGTRQKGLNHMFGIITLAIAIFCAGGTAIASLVDVGSGRPAPLQMSLPILSAGETVELQVNNIPLWQTNLSWLGLASILAGVLAIAWTFLNSKPSNRVFSRATGMLLVAFGILLQRDGAPWFYGVLAATILILLFLPAAWQALRRIPEWFRSVAHWWRKRRESTSDTSDDNNGEQTASVTTLILLFALTFASLACPCLAEEPAGFEAADTIQQEWQVSHEDSRLNATGTISVTGKPGDRFLLLKDPAVLTQFDGNELRLTKGQVPGIGLVYIVSIPLAQESTDDGPIRYRASFQFQLDAVEPMKGIALLTGTAAVQKINIQYDEPGWDITSAEAVRVESTESDGKTTEANVLLGPGSARIVLKPKARDVTAEDTQFFVECFNLYLPKPGVVDGRHRLQVRPSQGQVSDLVVVVPDGLTVSGVDGPVGSWQFDADEGRLKIEVEPNQSQAFDIMVDTQRSLESLPTDVALSPLRVADADGEVGLLAIAFGADAQPEKTEPTTMSAVNLGDFDSRLIPNKQATLHRVYRYGAEGGELAVRVASVAPEVRVLSKQVLSLGDERVVLAVNFRADITRAGLFQLSFPLPDGLEVESLTGAALHHWAELTEDDQRQIILHLNGKTIGSQSFSLALAGSAPTAGGDWTTPQFALNEATRQTGELVVRPTTGIRLRTVSRQNVSETDPRTIGGSGQGALAFRLLQRDWSLVLGIEKLDPWVTGQILHDVTVREGQTRSAILANFNVQNASIRSLQVTLPITDEDEIRTLRASGDTVSDFVRTAPDSNVWDVRFKRRVIGRNQFRIEYERRGDRVNENELLSPASFPQARQLAYFFSVRAGGRLEIEHDTLTQGWQKVDWNSIPQALRDAGNRTAPALSLRAAAASNAMSIRVKRHSLANALKLRVADGTLTTVLSPNGDQLTAVDVTMEVIQRSSLHVELPSNGKLFSIFVNGESVHSIRHGGDSNTWQFYILPGIDDRTAGVRFVYSVAGESLDHLTLTSPKLNVPLENIEWKVVVPRGFELTDSDGNLEQTGQASRKNYDRDLYLSKSSGKRQVQAQHAAKLLEQANQLLQAGDQSKARWALNSVANQYALDAASNEDARVQLENLQTQQAIVGLHTRRQRLYLDNNLNDSTVNANEQLRQAAADNPVLQQDQLNFQPRQLTQLLQGNTTEDNAVLQQIAGRLVQHQRTTAPAPQAIIISLPEEGTVYSFNRSVQVAENAPMELDLSFGLRFRLQIWQIAVIATLLVVLCTMLAVTMTKRAADETGISAVE